MLPFSLCVDLVYLSVILSMWHLPKIIYRMVVVPMPLSIVFLSPVHSLLLSSFDLLIAFVQPFFLLVENWQCGLSAGF